MAKRKSFKSEPDLGVGVGIKVAVGRTGWKPSSHVTVLI